MIFKFWGKVKRGFNRGKKLGFPTANLNLNKTIPEGIYLSRVKIDHKSFPSITFIGSAKTFNDAIYQAEVYILKYNQDLYKKWISVTLIKKIRDNKKFKSVTDLTGEMKKDLQRAKEYFGV